MSDPISEKGTCAATRASALARQGLRRGGRLRRIALRSSPLCAYGLRSDSRDHGHEHRADELRDERATVAEALTDKRTKVEQIETEAVDAFNDHMAAVLDILEYQNIDRVWIERTERTVREGRQKVEKTVFELHVVRTTENGTAYEDTVEHLSESEREVVGLVFALAVSCTVENPGGQGRVFTENFFVDLHYTYLDYVEKPVLIRDTNVGFTERGEQ